MSDYKKTAEYKKWKKRLLKSLGKGIYEDTPDYAGKLMTEVPEEETIERIRHKIKKLKPFHRKEKDTSEHSTPKGIKIHETKSEFRIRIRPPKKFKINSFRTKKIKTGINIIIGKLKHKKTTTVQSYRFDKDKFLKSEVIVWLSKHKIKRK
jgi:hypothetical protein